MPIKANFPSLYTILSNKDLPEVHHLCSAQGVQLLGDAPFVKFEWLVRVGDTFSESKGVKLCILYSSYTLVSIQSCILQNMRVFTPFFYLRIYSLNGQNDNADQYIS